MFPNPQDALPLPPRPSVEQYRKLAKDLVRSCRSGDPGAVRAWVVRWIEALASLQRDGTEIQVGADQVEQFVRRTLAGGDDRTLAGAQFVIARAHGFLSWPRFVKHIESLARPGSPVSAFEAAASAVVTGDVAAIRGLLREHPELIRERSTREHRATLLHYVAANGVENYRQLSPRNSAEIAELLLAAGAEVDAEANIYGGGCTTLGLVATSTPPAIAGVQQEVIDVLLDHGASLDRHAAGGNNQTLVHACLANGQPEAAEYLAGCGAPLDLAGAAGLGRIGVVKRLLQDDARTATEAQRLDGFALACAYGRADVVDLLLRRGVAVDAQLRLQGKGHTGLHAAAYRAQADVVDVLLRWGARVDVIDKTWGTPPLVWALTGWSREPGAKAAGYYNVVARLVAAGADLDPRVPESDEARADPRMLAALTPNPELHRRPGQA